MPITQARMLSVLAAARDYQQALNRVGDYIEQSLLEHEKGRLTIEQCITRILTHSRPSLLLAHPEQSYEVISKETAHFSRERRRNERKAEKLREDRMDKALNRPKRNRGNGAEYGILGAAKALPVLGHIEPDPTLSQPAQTGYKLDFPDELDVMDGEEQLDQTPPMDETTKLQIDEFFGSLDENGNRVESK